MILLDFKNTFQVKCGALGVAISAVLSQYDKHVAYFSEKLNDVKNNYSTYHKEFYVVIKYLKKWRHYLIPKDFILHYGNHALQFITRQEKLNQRHAKWVEFMHNFTFVTKHISGSANKFVDALSMRRLILQEFQVKTLEFQHLKEMYQEDLDFKEDYEACENPFLRDTN